MMVVRKGSGSPKRGTAMTGTPESGDAFVRRVLEDLPIPLVVLRPDLTASLLNGAMRAILAKYGRDAELFARGPVTEFVAEDDRPAVAEAVQSAFASGRATVEAAGLTHDGQLIPLSFTGVRVMDDGVPALIVLVTDFSDRQDLVQRLVHAQKMESLGRLAGGVAHDFNNLLMAVMSFTEVALLDTPEGDPRREDLESIREAVLKAADLTRMLLTFGRRQLLMPKRVEVNALILEVDRMLRRLIGEDVELVLLPGSDVGPVRVDPGQMESALLNLAVNARDAMPEGGTLTIATESSVEGDQRWVRISVTDTGTGMTPETLARIFEPFFTTKETGASGLGLASLHGFVMQSGGRVDVQTAPGTGTTFIIDLPAMTEAPSEVSSGGQTARAVAGQTVLLAEDNSRARRGIAAMLRALGYTVLEAEHGEDALRVAAAHDGPIALLLSDVVMPKMNVTTLVERMRASRPQTRILLMSGYTDDAVVRAGVQDGTVAFLPKPFTADTLAEKLRDVLG